MATVHFTPQLQRHVNCTSQQAQGATVRDVLNEVFREQPAVRGYVLDDQSRLRPHVMVYVGDQMIVDRAHLSDAVPADGDVYVMQALSGG